MTDATESADLTRADNFRRNLAESDTSAFVDAIYVMLRRVRLDERARCAQIADAVAAAARAIALMTDDSEHVTITGVEIGALDVAARIRSTDT